MACTRSLHGMLSRERTKTRKRIVVFDSREGYHDRRVAVPCGSCPGCLLERARQWSLRCVHEASLWKVNSFVTLTYGPESVPSVMRAGQRVLSLHPPDVTNFLKRLRNARWPERVRFFQCGEYGALGRPHHHAVLFNVDFPDKKVWKASASGLPLFVSEELKRLWPYGHSSIGTVTQESAGYTARYTLKKLGTPCARGVVGPYVTMSRRPGIGTGWFRKWSSDVYPLDKMVTWGGRVSRPPRFYDELLKKERPGLYRRLKARRLQSMRTDSCREEARAMREYQREVNTERRIRDYLKRGIE